MICYDSRNKNMNKQTPGCEKKSAFVMDMLHSGNMLSDKHVGWAF